MEQASQSAQQSNAVNPSVAAFFDKQTHTFSYVVQDPASSACAIIDSVLNFDFHSGAVDHHSADEIIRYVENRQLQVEWIIETHVHADHLTAAPYLQERLGGRIGIGEHVDTVQATFARIFNEDKNFAVDGSQFDHLFTDGERYQIGTMPALVMHTPGHTPACTTHVIGDAAFVGDTLFMPDAGTARADFPGGDASRLFQSIQKILQLPGDTRIFLCHDYGAEGREEIEYVTTVRAEREHNIHVNKDASETGFVKWRNERDATLDVPDLILPSLQVNMRAGHLPPAEDNQVSYLKIPVNAFKQHS